MNYKQLWIYKFLVRSFYFDNWPIIIFQRVFYRQARLLAFRRGRIEFVVDYRGHDHNGIMPCLTDGMYSHFFCFLERNRPLRILDIGANAGGFSLTLLAEKFSFEKLVCVEMNRRTCIRLQYNISQNFECDAVVLNAAAGGRSGTISVQDNLGGTGESIYLKPGDAVKAIEIQMVTLDQLVMSHFGPDASVLIDLCKIDIEGAEWELFQGSVSQAMRRVQHLIIEIHPCQKWSEVELIEIICNFGFEVAMRPAKGEARVFLFSNVAKSHRSKMVDK